MIMAEEEAHIDWNGQESWIRAWDDTTGEELIGSEVTKARELEISEIERKLTGAKITNMIRPGPLRS